MSKLDDRVKIRVSGEIDMSVENWNNLLEYDDPHLAITYALHMGYVNSEGLEYEPIE